MSSNVNVIQEITLQNLTKYIYFGPARKTKLYYIQNANNLTFSDAFFH